MKIMFWGWVFLVVIIAVMIGTLINETSGPFIATFFIIVVGIMGFKNGERSERWEKEDE